jgi:hypothetical protein
MMVLFLDLLWRTGLCLRVLPSFACLIRAAQIVLLHATRAGSALPGLTRCSLPGLARSLFLAQPDVIRRTPELLARLSCHVFRLRVTERIDSRVLHLRMHALHVFLPRTLYLCITGFYRLRQRLADDLPRFYRLAASCLRLMKSSSISAPSQFM